ncbi:HNH endonuclease [Rhodococcus erythropolis]|nr:HNH endonuclease [Rhodococcus erythropolis]
MTLPQYHPDSGTAHHYPVPYSQGGSDELSNLVPAHLECNQKQGDKLDPVIDRTSREWI